MPVNEPELSVVVPAQNEEGSIYAVLTELVAAIGRRNIEIVVVDDASTDSTAAEISRFVTDRKINLIVRRKSCSSGMGGALAEGLMAATGGFVSWIPGDGQYSAEELIRAIYASENWESILFNRTSSIERNSVRKLITRIMQMLAKTRLGVTLEEYSGIFLAPRIGIQQQIPRENSVIFTLRIAQIIQQMGPYSWKPLSLQPRLSGESKVLTPRGLLLNFREIIRNYD